MEALRDLVSQDLFFRKFNRSFHTKIEDCQDSQNTIPKMMYLMLFSLFSTDFFHF